jgi:hypothetical protein
MKSNEIKALYPAPLTGYITNLSPEQVPFELKKI